MKLTSLLIIGGLLWWSWAKILEPVEVNFETHALIQQQLGDWIAEKVKSQNPSFEDFRILRIWTENMNSHDKPRVKAVIHFAYRLPSDSQPVYQESQTTFVLERTTKKAEEQIWSIVEQGLVNQMIVFEEGETLKVSPYLTPDSTPPEEGQNPSNQPSLEESK